MTDGGDSSPPIPGVRAGSVRTALLLYAALAVVVVLVTAASAQWLPDYPHSLKLTPSRAAWWRVWANWDGDWYRRIAQYGYVTTQGPQQSIAYFPAYPLLVRLGTLVTGSVVFSGVMISIASGAAVAVLFGEWLTDRLSRPAVIASLLALLVYPYAFYLYGPMYADALFVACAIGAFVALERGYPWVAGAVGIFATAARPVGIVVVIGLLARAWELTRPETVHATGRAATMSRRTALLAVSVSACGLLGYSTFLWVTRGDPLAFVSAERGWHQSPGLSTWMKGAFFVHLSRVHTAGSMVRFVAHPVVMIAGLALVPGVKRRFGSAYALYAGLVILLPAVATKDFFGMGRYALAAFPCFAVAGELIAARPKVGRLVLITSSGLLVLFATQFGRGAYLS